jgi:hypothetical protein
LQKEVASRAKHRHTRRFVVSGLFDGIRSFGELERRIAQLPKEQDRGDAFEVFAEAYLATQKIIGAEQVWPDKEIPIAVLDACRLPLKDMGADGVYKTWSGLTTLISRSSAPADRNWIGQSCPRSWGSLIKSASAFSSQIAMNYRR